MASSLSPASVSKLFRLPVDPDFVPALPFPLSFDAEGGLKSSKSSSESTATGFFFLATGFGGGGGSSTISTSESSTFMTLFGAAMRFFGGGGPSSSLSFFLITTFDPDGAAEAGFLASAAFLGFGAALVGLKSSSSSSALSFLGAAPSFPPFRFFFLPASSAAQSLPSQSSQVCYNMFVNLGDQRRGRRSYLPPDEESIEIGLPDLNRSQSEQR